MEHIKRLYRNRTQRPNAIKIAGWVLGGIILAVIFAFLFGYFVMLLWNWIMPALFGLPEITYWMGFGIILLGRLIFGNFGPGHHKRDDRRKRYYNSRCGSDKFGKWKDKKWQHYENFWEEEGEQAFDKYVALKNDSTPEDKEENPVS